jgi:hypothetical protein
MKTLKLGTRVRYLDHPFLSDGYVKKVIKDFGYLIKLDKKAPNEYAWETDELLSFPSDIEEIV